MEITKKYENFPFGIVILSGSASFLVYLCGLIITYNLSLIAAILYLVYILALEFRLLSRHCVNCYYWGKMCGFGKGRVSSMFFKKGDSLKFCEKSFTWKDMIPDLLVPLVPFLTGIALMIVNFKFIILFAMVTLVTLTTVGNGYIRGNLTCKYCRQRDLGCPAEQLFSKK